MDDLTADVIDSREIEERIADLITREAEYGEEDAAEELEEILKFKSLFDLTEWDNGVTIIAEHYFTEYAEEYAKDSGLINGDTEGWPFTAIDWDEAASELQQDYTSYEFNGETYYARA